MNNNDTLELIIKHGLTVRQIPTVIQEKYFCDKDYIPQDNEKIITEFGRTLRLRETKPLNGGKWLAKSCNNNMSTIRWNCKTDNMSNTLQETVAKAVESLNAAQASGNQ